MKTKLSLILGGLLLLGQTAMAASSFTLNMSAQVPAATGVTLSVSQVIVNSAGSILSFVPQGSAITSGSALLDFGKLQLVTNSNGSTFFSPGTTPGQSFYYAVDVAPAGAGTLNPTFTYGAGTLDIGGSAGIAFSQMTFVSASSSTETALGIHPMMKNVAAVSLSGPTFFSSGHWMRMDIGLCTGNPATDPTGCVPFTGGSAAGTYTGSVGVTATIS